MSSLRAQVQQGEGNQDCLLARPMSSFSKPLFGSMQFRFFLTRALASAQESPWACMRKAMTTAGLRETPAWQWTSTLCLGSCWVMKSMAAGRCGKRENSSSSSTCSHLCCSCRCSTFWPTLQCAYAHGSITDSTAPTRRTARASPFPTIATPLRNSCPLPPSSAASDTIWLQSKLIIMLCHLQEMRWINWPSADSARWRTG